MKNLVTSVLFVLAFAAAHLAQAQTIRRVNNTGISGTNIYSDLPAALTAAAAGDIIQVEPSGTPYSATVVTKNVTIVGPGYFLDPTQNPGLQANPTTATVNSIDIQAGGESAYIAGLTVGTYSVRVSNVTVQRCNITVQLIPNYNSPAIPLTNINVLQCYFSQNSTGGNINTYAGGAIDNLLFSNNIFLGYTAMPTNYNGGFFNNVVIGVQGTNMNNFFVTNNYFTHNTNYGGNDFNGAGNTLSNNISRDASLPTTNGNQINVPVSAVFNLSPGATAFDAWYLLKTGTNPARGTGQGGTDVGAFGGNAPYKLGGLPNIPAIYQQTQTITGNSLNGTLSTRSNN